MATDRQRLEEELAAEGIDFQIQDGVRGRNGDLRFKSGWYTVTLRPAAEPPDRPSRRLILCIDGTWNDPESRTNVARLAQALATDERSDQVIRYYSGVGVRLNQGPSYEMRHNWRLALASAATNWKFLPRGVRRWLQRRADSKAPDRSKTLLAGGLGFGIDEIRRRAFFDLAAIYRPGDEIYIFGFSRGAAIARLLAQQIAEIGIPSRLEATFRVSALESDIIDRDLDLAPTRTTPPAIKMLGVWDTVASYVIPGEHNVELFKRDLRVADTVEAAYHLVAIDERRAAFFPTLMECEDKVQEIWFPGVHTNVGGGYVNPETETADFGISDITLNFMIHRAKEHGLSFADPSPLKPPVAPNLGGPIEPSPWKLNKKDRKMRIVGGSGDKAVVVHKSVESRRKVVAYEPRPLLALNGEYETDYRD